jgi:Spy/CpxP family protein refolding chaperone
MSGKIYTMVQKSVFMVLILGLVAGLAAFDWPRGGGAGMGHPGHGMGPGRGGMMGKGWMMMNLTPEQAGQVFDLRQKFMNDTAGLRKEMMVKRAELAQLWKTDKPDEKAILAKVKELGALRTQLMEKAVTLRLEISKIVPGWGGPMMGPGRGPGARTAVPEVQDDLSLNDTFLDQELAMAPAMGN